MAILEQVRGSADPGAPKRVVSFQQARDAITNWWRGNVLTLAITEAVASPGGAQCAPTTSPTRKCLATEEPGTFDGPRSRSAKAYCHHSATAVGRNKLRIDKNFQSSAHHPCKRHSGGSQLRIAKSGGPQGGPTSGWYVRRYAGQLSFRTRNRAFNNRSSDIILYQLLRRLGKKRNRHLV